MDDSLKKEANVELQKSCKTSKPYWKEKKTCRLDGFAIIEKKENIYLF